MADFDPDKYIQDNTSGFDPDKYIAENSGANPSSYSKLESALMGGVNQFNAAPAVLAAVQHPMSAIGQIPGIKQALQLGSMIAGPDYGGFDANAAGKNYNDERAALKAQFDKAYGDNKKSYTLGNIGGGLLTTPFLPGVGTASEGANLIANGVKMGGALGALNGAGNALSSGDNILGVADEAALSAPLGAVFGGAMGALVNKLRPTTLDSDAAINNIKSMMPTKSMSKILTSAPMSEDVSDAAGNVLYKAPEGNTYLEQAGNVLNPILKIFEGPEARADAIESLIDKTGQALGNIKQSISDAGGTFDGVDDVYNFLDGLKTKLNLVPKNNPSGAAFETSEPTVNYINSLKNDLMRIMGTGDSPISFEQATEALDKLKQQGYVNGQVGDNISSQIASMTRGFMNDAVNKSLADQASNISPELFQSFMQNKELYRAASAVKAAAEGASAKQIANSDFGLLSLGRIAAGAHVGGPLGAIVGLGLDQAAKTGNLNLAASTAQQLASKGFKAADSIGNQIASYTPEVLTSMSQKLSQSESPTLQHLGNIFSQAASKDQVGRNALMFTLLQNPTYNKILNSVTGGNNQ